MGVAPRSNTGSPNEPEIPLRGTDPEELRAQVQTDLHAPTAALFATANGWKRPSVRNGRMDTDKHNVVHPDNRILFSL